MDNLETLLDNKIHHLKIISKLDPSSKLSIASPDTLTIHYRSNLLPEWMPDIQQAFKRYVSSDTRSETKQFLDNLVKDVITISSAMMMFIKNMEIEDVPSKHEKETCTRYISKLHMLSNEMDKAQGGMKHLAETYKTDPNIVSKIEYLCTTLNEHSDKIKNNLDVV